MKVPVTGVNHIGIAVESIEENRFFYEEVLGLRFEGIEEVEDQGVRAAIFYAGDTRIELLEPISDESPIGRFIRKKGQGIHHIAFSVESIEEKVRELLDSGVSMVDEAPRPGIHGTRIAFIHPGSAGGVLVELCQ